MSTFRSIEELVKSLDREKELLKEMLLNGNLFRSVMIMRLK